MLKITQTDWGQFDLAYSPDLNDQKAAFETLIYVLLMTDAEADAVQMPDRTQKRGWWHDPQLGSLIWWYRQQPLTPALRSVTVTHISALLNSHPALSNVAVIDISDARNVSGLMVSISATYNDLTQILTVSL